MSSKLRQLTRDTVLYGISTILGRFISFLLVPLYTNLFNPVDYGVIANLYAPLALFTVVFLFGMDTAYLKYAGMSGQEERSRLFPQAFYPILIIDICAALLIILCRNPIAAMLGIPDHYRHLINYLAVILVLDALSSLPFITLRLQKKALKFSLIRVSNIVLTIVLNIVLIKYLRLGIEAVFIANAAASVFNLVVLSPVIIAGLKEQFNNELFRKLFKFGLPYLPAGIASMVMQVIDRPIVQEMAGMKALGIYQANYKLGIFMMLFVSMFQFAWQPFFLENAKEPNAKQLFASVFTYFTAVGCFILISLSLFINELATFQVHGWSLIGREFWSGLNIVPVILLAYLFNGFYANFSAGLFIKAKNMAFPVILGLGAVSNILVNILLIPPLGITGAAFATLFSYVLMAVGFYFVSNKHYPIQYEYSKLAVIVLITALIGGSYYLLLSAGWANAAIRAALLIIYIAALFVFKILNRQSLFLLRRKKKLPD